MARLLRFLAAALLFIGLPIPAEAAVTMTFWSHELGNSFPHAFVTLRGYRDAGGPPLDANYGFTAKSVSPALLFHSVPGRIDIAKPGYIDGSDAQFSVTLTDAQLDQVLALVAAWDETSGNSRYDLKTRNCVHFVEEAARIVGLTGLEQPRLMKKPRSYLKAVEAANAGRVTPVNQHGKEYLAGLAPLDAPAVTAPVTVAPSAHDDIPDVPGKTKAAAQR